MIDQAKPETPAAPSVPAPQSSAPKAPAPSALDAALFPGDPSMEFEDLDMTDWSADSFDEPDTEPGFFNDPGQFPDGV